MKHKSNLKNILVENFFLKISLLSGVLFLPLLTKAEGQDWMMFVDNGVYFFKLLGAYILGAMLLNLIFRKQSNKKFPIIFIFIILIVFIIHWEKTKERKMNAPIEEYLNSQNIDTTKL